MLEEVLRHRGVLGLAEEGDEALGVLRVAAALGDDHVVDPGQHAFLRIQVLQGRLHLTRAHRRAAPEHRHVDFAGSKVLANRAGLGTVGLDEGLLRLEQGQHLLHLLGVLAAQRDVQVDAGRVDHFADRIEHVDLALQLRRRVEQHVVAVGRALVDGGIQHHAGGPPDERHGVGALRVPGRRLQVVDDVRVVRLLRRIEALQQVLLDQDRHELVRGDRHVVARTALLQLGQQGFVGVVGIHRDLDAALLLELLEDLRREVAAPAHHVQLLGGLRPGSQAQRQRGPYGNDQLAHASTPSVGLAQAFFLPSR
ncbi:hypothetical protein D3C78_1118210 [compost metagenome]